MMAECVHTCACLARHAVGLGLVVPVLVLEAHQVRVRLQAQTGPHADDVLVGGVDHLLHLHHKTNKHTQRLWLRPK